jgi:hypothetical protein
MTVIERTASRNLTGGYEASIIQFLQMQQNTPLPRPYPTLYRPVADTHDNLVFTPLRSIAPVPLVYANSDALTGHAATDSRLRERPIAIGLSTFIVLVERVARQSLGRHVTGEGQWIVCLLVGVLQNRTRGEDAVAAHEQRPALQWSRDLARSPTGLLRCVPVIEPGTSREIDFAARCA